MSCYREEVLCFNLSISHGLNHSSTCILVAVPPQPNTETTLCPPVKDIGIHTVETAFCPVVRPGLPAVVPRRPL